MEKLFVVHQYTPYYPGCSKSVSLSGNGMYGMPSGIYKKQAMEHNNKPVYKYSGGVPTKDFLTGGQVDWCIFQVGVELVKIYSHNQKT